MSWTTSDIVTLVSLVLLSVVLMVVLPISATANVSNKLEYVADLSLEQNLTDDDAKHKAEDYNQTHECGAYYARAVADEYNLWGGIAELV